VGGDFGEVEKMNQCEEGERKGPVKGATFQLPGGGTDRQEKAHSQKGTARILGLRKGGDDERKYELLTQQKKGIKKTPRG